VYSVLAALLPAGVVTMTLAEPAAWLGTVAVIEVAFTTETLVAAAPPTVTPVAPVKFVPVIVTLVPPAVGPEFGLTEVTVGAGVAINWTLSTPTTSWPFVLAALMNATRTVVPATAAAVFGTVKVASTVLGGDAAVQMDVDAPPSVELESPGIAEVA
jgi:hypothetical protein